MWYLASVIFLLTVVAVPSALLKRNRHKISKDMIKKICRETTSREKWAYQYRRGD